jgi:predicted lysophospholipase L1 biosynthesis ABC-type transport system permease subunit
MVGYPFLFLAAVSFLRGRTKWLWVFASLGAIAPISIFNSFSHIHTPILISMIRTVTGLVLGIMIGTIVSLVAKRYLKIRSGNLFIPREVEG